MEHDIVNWCGDCVSSDMGCDACEKVRCRGKVDGVTGICLCAIYNFPYSGFDGEILE